MLDLRSIKAISLDLDDTLWPIMPTIERAEQALRDWLSLHAPQTAALYADPEALRRVRAHVATVLLIERPELAHDFSALRRESIRVALTRGGDDPALAESAFEVFFEVRQQVVLYDDAHAALTHLGSRFPLVAISNGNADVGRVGLGHHFQHALSAREFGVGKPDPRIFHEAVRRLNLQPQQVLHVGDDAHLDAQGALDAGLQAVWLNRDGKPWPRDEECACLVVSSLDELREQFKD